MAADKPSAEEEQKIWDSYNHLLLSPDVSRLQKLLAKTELYKMTLGLPGDIVELGVLKGTGFIQLCKLVRIFEPNSAKRVIGFDMFSMPPIDDATDQAAMADYFKEASFDKVDPDSIVDKACAVGMTKSSAILVPGDVCKTVHDFVAESPGFRASLVYMDLDLGAPTAAGLEALWPRVVRGGVVVFDEYAVPRWSESEAVDAFLAKHPDVQIKSLPWARTPTAYIVKP